MRTIVRVFKGIDRIGAFGCASRGKVARLADRRAASVRRLAKRFHVLPPAAIERLLASEVHEHRSIALVILNGQQAAHPERTTELYLAAVRGGRVNNWDLVDVSAEFILGEYLFDRPRDLLFDFARSDSLWERRVAIIATFGFIKRGDASTMLAIAEVLLADRADLIQKAVGWMLREVGKRVDRALLLAFLDAHAAELGRTALSYAVERLSPEQRAHYRIPEIPEGRQMTLYPAAEGSFGAPRGDRGVALGVRERGRRASR